MRLSSVLSVTLPGDGADKGVDYCCISLLVNRLCSVLEENTGTKRKTRSIPRHTTPRHPVVLAYQSLTKVSQDEEKEQIANRKPRKRGKGRARGKKAKGAERSDK